MVQLAPTANAAVQVPPAREKGAPPTTVNTPPARGSFPVLVTVRVCVGAVVPVAQLPKARVAGLTLAVKVGATPVPFRATGEPSITWLAAMVSVAPSKPGVAPGANTTLMVHPAAGTATLTTQVPPAAPAGREYSGEENVRPVMVNPVPGFTVSVWAALVHPSTTVPKLKSVGDT